MTGHSLGSENIDMNKARSLSEDRHSLAGDREKNTQVIDHSFNKLV